MIFWLSGLKGVEVMASGMLIVGGSFKGAEAMASWMLIMGGSFKIR